MRSYKYQCSYCDKKYKQEVAFYNHDCEQKIRSDEIKTPSGQRAYDYYQEWMDAKGYHRAGITTFIESHYYKAFIRFSIFARKVNLPLPKEYIRVMVEHTMQPTMWTDNKAYKYYIEYLDRRVSPKKQAKLSANTILSFCDKNQIDTSEFFDYIVPNELLQFIIGRHLSPWFLLNSERFRKYYTDVFSDAHIDMFDDIHSLTQWSVKFAKHPKEVKYIKQMVLELDL